MGRKLFDSPETSVFFRCRDVLKGWSYSLARCYSFVSQKIQKYAATNDVLYILIQDNTYLIYRCASSHAGFLSNSQ